MKKYRGIASSDGMNRNGQFMTFGALHNGYASSWKNGLPSNINHDRTRTIGWNRLSGIYLEPGKAYITNTLFCPENEDDRLHLNNLILEYNQRVYIHEREDALKTLKDKLGDTLSDNGRAAPLSAVAFEDKGIVARVFPELGELMDDDGLIGAQYLEAVRPGIFKRGEYLLFAHRYLRRSCSICNSLNGEFLDRFQKLHAERPDLALRIHLDPDVIGLAGTDEGEMEFAYWWGPHFDNDLSRIPLGVTRHQNDDQDKMYSNVIFTEFGWYVQDGNKTLEIEEVCDRATILRDKQSYVGCRYVHSFLDQRTGLPIHLDGAIRAYTEEKILGRMDDNLKHVSRDSCYTKLWRIDGDLPVELWKELITHYFRDNMLVGEYFCGQDEVLDSIKREEHKETDTVPLPIKKYIPVDMNAGDGLRVFYCFHPLLKTSSYDIEVYPRQYICTVESQHQDIMEAETLSILKLLHRYGASISPTQILRVFHNDMVFNFPLFCCNSVASASLLQRAILELCCHWQKADDDRLISYSIIINADQNQAFKISFAGHIADFIATFERIGTEFPNPAELFPWLESLYQVVSSYKTASQEPKVYDILTPFNELCFERVTVPSKYIHFNKETSAVSLAGMKLSKKEYFSLLDKNIHAVNNGIIRRSQCTSCGRDYENCDCIKFIDDTNECITEFDTLGFTWTNRCVYKGKSPYAPSFP